MEISQLLILRLNGFVLVGHRALEDLNMHPAFVLRLSERLNLGVEQSFFRLGLLLLFDIFVFESMHLLLQFHPPSIIPFFLPFLGLRSFSESRHFEGKRLDAFVAVLDPSLLLVDDRVFGRYLGLDSDIFFQVRLYQFDLHRLRVLEVFLQLQLDYTFRLVQLFGLA